MRLLLKSILFTFVCFGYVTGVQALNYNQCLSLFSGAVCSVKSPAAQALMMACETKRKELRCDEFQNMASAADQKKYFSCGSSDASDICDQNEKQTGPLLISCGKGLGGAIIDIGEGILNLPATVMTVIRNGTKNKIDIKACSNDFSQKLALLGPLRPTEMTDETVKRMSCREINQFINQKVDTIIAKLNERRLQRATLSGKENTSVYDLVLTEKEKQALNYDQKNSGELRKALCYHTEEAAKLVCKDGFNAAMTMTSVVGGVSAVRWLLGAKKIETVALAATPTKAIEEALEIKPITPSPATLKVKNLSLADVEKIDFSKITQLKKGPSNSGIINKAVAEGQLNGEKVFIKTSHVTENGVGRADLGILPSSFTDELAWTQRLSDLGIGPKLKGYTVQDGNLAIVTEFVEGQSVGLMPTFPKWFKLDPKFKPTPATIESLEKIKHTIQSEGIYADDLQIRFNNNQAFVQDGSRFKPATNTAQIAQATKVIDELIAKLKAGFAK